MNWQGFSYPHKSICAIQNMSEIKIVRQGGEAVYPPHQCSGSRPPEAAHEQYKALPIILVSIVEHLSTELLIA